MSNSADASIHSAKKPQSSVDLLEGELSKRFTSQEAEITSLRETNSKLREQLAEFRKRDLERATNEDNHRANELELQRLRKNESALRIALASRDTDQEKRIDDANKSVAEMQKSVADQQAAMSQFRDDLNRKLAKLTDDSWAKDLEIESLRSQHAAEEALSMRLKAECSIHLGKLHDAMVRQNDLENLVAEKESEIRSLNEEHSRALRETTKAHMHEVESLQETNAVIRTQMNRLGADCAKLENEIEALQKDSEKQMQELMQRLQLEREEFGRVDAERRAKIQQLEADCGERVRQLEQAHQILAALEQELKTSATELQNVKDHAAQMIHGLTQQNAQQAEMFRNRESQLNGELSRLRVEHSNLEKLLKDSNETVEGLRATLDSLKNQQIAERRDSELEAERRRTELQTKLQSEFQQQFEIVLSENKKMRQLLDVRDTQTESDRKNLKQWQEQLNFLDQYLRQSKDSLKKDKAEISRLAKQLTSELQLARNHPFKDYVELAEIEISHLQVQLNNTSSLSPIRPKVEERLQQMIEHRDFLKTCLAKTQRQLEERTHAVATIVKGANAPM